MKNAEISYTHYHLSFNSHDFKIFFMELYFKSEQNKYSDNFKLSTNVIQK